jgi:tRNA A37 threonylcarbamoyltransferase TsaD
MDETSHSRRQNFLIALIVSGHSFDPDEGHHDYERLGSTLGNAAGEAFDKVARLLELPPTQGPFHQKPQARQPNRIYIPDQDSKAPGLFIQQFKNCCST